MDRPRRGLSCAVIGVALAAATLLGACETAPSPATTAVAATLGPSGGSTANPSTSAEGPSAGPPATPFVPPAIEVRADVPDELRGLYWYTSNGYAGSVGTTAVSRVGSDEYIVAVGPGRTGEAGLVVSVREREEAPDVRAELLVRRLGEVEPFLTTDTELTRVYALIVPIRNGEETVPRLFWTGLSGRGIVPDILSVTDGGTYAADLDRGFDAIREIVPAGTDLAEFGEEVDHGPLSVDPTGRYVLSRVAGFGATRTTVVDALEQVPRGPAWDLNGVVISGDVAITYVEGRGLPYIEAVDVVGANAGEVRWRFPSDTSSYELFDVEDLVAIEGGVVVGYQRAGAGFNEWAITSIELESGKPRDLYVQKSEDDPIRHLAGQLSSPTLLALTPDFWEASILNGDAISVLRPEGGDPSFDVFRIAIP